MSCPFNLTLPAWTSPSSTMSHPASTPTSPPDGSMYTSRAELNTKRSTPFTFRAPLAKLHSALLPVRGLERNRMMSWSRFPETYPMWRKVLSAMRARRSSTLYSTYPALARFISATRAWTSLSLMYLA